MTYSRITAGRLAEVLDHFESTSNGERSPHAEPSDSEIHDALLDLYERAHEAEAEVERLRASLRNARAAIADIHCHVNEDRYQRAMRAMHLVAREIEAVLAPEAKEEVRDAE